MRGIITLPTNILFVITEVTWLTLVFIQIRTIWNWSFVSILINTPTKILGIKKQIANTIEQDAGTVLTNANSYIGKCLKFSKTTLFFHQCIERRQLRDITPITWWIILLIFINELICILCFFHFFIIGHQRIILLSKFYFKR